jgi:hypothetical protein
MGVTPQLAAREGADQGRPPVRKLSLLAADPDHPRDGEDADLWSARDALVLKAMALVLGEHLPVSHRCTHIKGHGGAKFAVREVRDHLVTNRFVLRTDVKSHYASIDHLLLLDELAVHIKDRRVLNLIGQ